MAMIQHDEALESFIAKWRSRWPEWRIAEAFVPASQRVTALAWFALLQELTDAAWGGDDPTPGLAKLAWWQEELQGWSQGRRRHPLGAMLQTLPATWMALSRELGELPRLRVLPHETRDGIAGLRAFSECVVAIETHLLGERSPDEKKPPAPELVAVSLLAMHPVLTNDARRRAALLSQWPELRGSRVRRIMAALTHARITGTAGQPLPPLRALWLTWRAARQ